jgi:large subunit ribosomal protein L29
MKAKELRQLSEGELLEKEKELSEGLFNLRFQHATGQLENVMRIPQVKRRSLKRGLWKKENKNNERERETKDINRCGIKR